MFFPFHCHPAWAAKYLAYIQVYQSDIEKAVQYSIMTEVANQAILNPQKLRAFTDYIETLVTFFPNISMELKHFLLSLQEWLRSMRFKALTMSAYKSKVLRALGDLPRAYHRHTG